MRFSPFDGTQTSPANIPISANWQDPAGTSGSTNLNLALDFRAVGNHYRLEEVSHDGYEPGFLNDYYFDRDGILHGNFTNGIVLPLAQLAIVDVRNRDGLENINGSKWRETGDSGTMEAYDLSQSKRADIIPEALEGSTIDVASGFVDLIQAQHAFSSLSRALAVFDEMTQRATDLKR